MPKGNELILSSSPHIHEKNSVRRIMLMVIVSLLPATAAAVYFFGLAACRVIAVTTASAFAAELTWFLLAKKPLSPLRDCSAVVTGLLLALNLPGSTPWWVCVLGGFLAIWGGKQVFGGIGHNIFNPALVARVALLIALPSAMTTWQPTVQEQSGKPEFTTTATPLGEANFLKNHHAAGRETYKSLTTGERYWDYLVGQRAGSLGETNAIALIIGGVFLMFVRLIKWQIPVFFVATVAVFSGLVNFFAPEVTPPAMFHILNGGLLLGAFFMATDMVTSPITTYGCIVFAIGCGVITSVIRIWGSYPEGVSFSILFMNALVPLIDKLFQIRPFGCVRKKA